MYQWPRQSTSHPYITSMSFEPENNSLRFNYIILYHNSFTKLLFWLPHADG
jgi:hypothetical protein